MRAFQFLIPALALSATLSAQAQPPSKYFIVPKDQAELAKDAVKDRFLHNPHPFSCVRTFYGRPELLKHPLDPSQYEILSRFASSMTPDLANTLPILNSHSEPWVCEVKWGYCMPTSEMARALNLLLLFDPSQPDPKLVNVTDHAVRFNYYDQILFNVWKDKKPQVIYGYHNLHEFVSDPDVKPIFYSSIPKNWGDLASIPAIGLGVLERSRTPMKVQKIVEEVTELGRKLGKGYNPLVFLGAKKIEYPGMQNPEAMQITAKKAAAPGNPIDQFPALDPNLFQNPAIANQPRMETASLASKAMDAMKDTYIHVTQLRSIESPAKNKWILTFIDPNGTAPNDIGQLTIDLSQPRPLVYQGATAYLYLDAFGELPGDRENMDEIVANLNDFATANPELFKKLKP